MYLLKWIYRLLFEGWFDNLLSFTKLNSFFRILLYLTIWIVCSGLSLFLLRSRRIAFWKKYSILSTTSIALICLIMLRTSTSRLRTFTFDKFDSDLTKKNKQILNKMRYLAIYEDYNGREVDLHQILNKRRQIALLEIGQKSEVIESISILIKEKKRRYFYVNFDNMLRNLGAKKLTDEKWAAIVQSLIVNLDRIREDKKVCYMFWDLRLPKKIKDVLNPDFWPKISDILDTFFRQVSNLNIILLSEDDDVTNKIVESSVGQKLGVYHIRGFSTEKMQEFIRDYMQRDDGEEEEEGTKAAVGVTNKLGNSLDQFVGYLSHNTKIEDHIIEQYGQCESEVKRQIFWSRSKSIIKGLIGRMAEKGRNVWIPIKEIKELEESEHKLEDLSEFGLVDISSGQIRFSNNKIFTLLSEEYGKDL